VRLLQEIGKVSTEFTAWCNRDADDKKTANLRPAQSEGFATLFVVKDRFFVVTDSLSYIESLVVGILNRVLEIVVVLDEVISASLGNARRH